MRIKPFNGHRHHFILIYLIFIAIPSFSLASGRCIEGNCSDGQGTYIEDNGARYSGAFLNSTYSGKGFIDYGNGNSYNGDFLNGHRHGHGELLWNGNQYTGGFANDQYSGHGTLLYANGNKYEGEFLNGYRHGIGMIEWNGDKYKGEFEFDKWSGEGTVEHANGDKYNGQFKAGFYSGHGTLTYADGSVYVGEFLNGKRHGKGSLKWNGDVYTGDFISGMFSGEGEIEYADGNRYNGEMLNGNWHGVGELEWNGDKYKGGFKQGKYSGNGALVKADGSMYEGELQNGYYHGSGKNISEVGEYEGRWKNGKWNGIGAFTYIDGKTYTGYFENGFKANMGTYTWGKDDDRITQWEKSVNECNQILEKGASLLEKGDYDEIDATADVYRKEKAIYPTGRWKLPTLYSALNSVSKEAPEIEWNTHLDLLEAWVAQRPNSITAHVALANFLIHYAFHGRGYDLAVQVTDEGWQLFRERLAKAAEILEKAEKLPTQCPHWWAVSISLAKAQSTSFPTLVQLLNRAVAHEPLYLAYYFRTADYLIPRWHGKEGAWEAFAHLAANWVGGPTGDFVYAQIVLWMGNTSPYDSVLKESRNIAWPRVKRGLDSISAYEKTLWTQGDRTLQEKIKGGLRL